MSASSFLDRHHLLLRRLHSLSGILPIGVFLIAHLTTNSSILWGRMSPHAEGGSGGVATFQHEVDFIHSLPALLLIEIFGLWLPIAFHAGLGVYYATTGRSNTRLYPYGANWRYALQRISGYVGVVFIFYHVATLRWGWRLPGSSAFVAERAASTTAVALRGGLEQPWQLAGILVGLLYGLGVSMLVYHFANGLWTAAITWGLTVSEHAMRRWGRICAVIGAGLMVIGWAALIGFVTLDLDAARAYETERLSGASGIVDKPAHPSGAPAADASEASPDRR